ncbi:MAG: hypothetical protein FJY10_02910 [Bacteroidetes bacterium]|nr:hypothetical protein [Bacteroidota bacterium]
MNQKDRISVVSFSAILLLLACTIRSDVIIDRSFLPRFITLSLLLIVFFPLSFKKIISPQKNLYLFSLIAFYLWNLLSSLWALSPQEALIQSQVVFNSMAVWIIVTKYIQHTAETEIIFIKFLMIFLTFSFALAFFRMSAIPFFDPYKIKSISANNNLYSGFLLISLPFVLTGYSILKKGWKFIALGIAILSVFFIIILQSRAVYLGLFLALVLLFLFLVIRYRFIINKANIINGIGALVLLLGLVFLFYSSLDRTRKDYFLSKIEVWDYFGTFENPEEEKVRRYVELDMATPGDIPPFDHSEAYYENANLRMIFWKKSLFLIQSHPFTGVGAGNWKLNIPSSPEPPNPDHTKLNYTYSQPHNEAISIISELGIVGLVLAFMIFLLPLVWAFICLIKRKLKPSFSLILFASFIAGFYLFSLFDFPLKRVEHNILFFSAIAFLLAKIPSETFSFRWLPEIPIKLFNGVMVFLLFFSLIPGIYRMMGEYYSLKMFRYERQNDDKVITYCRKAHSFLYDITPNSLPLAWFEGVAQYRKGNMTEAVICFEKAIERTPFEVRVLNDYGASLFATGNPVKAKLILRRSIRIDPFFDDARFNLSAMHYFSGRKDSALFYIIPCRDSQKKKDFLEELGVRDSVP